MGKTDQAIAMMSMEERKEFKVDVTSFDWAEGYHNQIYGLRRFYLKEDVMAPESKFKQVLQKNNPDYFHDIQLAWDTTSNLVYKNNSVYFKDILSQTNFNVYVNRLMKQSGSKPHVETSLALPNSEKRN